MNSSGNTVDVVRDSVRKDATSKKGSQLFHGGGPGADP